jgi:hypothetical protein
MMCSALGKVHDTLPQHAQLAENIAEVINMCIVQNEATLMFVQLENRIYIYIYK